MLHVHRLSFVTCSLQIYSPLFKIRWVYNCTEHSEHNYKPSVMPAKQTSTEHSEHNYKPLVMLGKQTSTEHSEHNYKPLVMPGKQTNRHGKTK